MVEIVLSRNFTQITAEYEKFAREKDACRKCSLYFHYKQVTQSEGNAKNPTFVFIGESAGADEVSQVRPFIGRAGQRLREELRKYKTVFNRENSLFTNLLPCRPVNNSFPTSAAGQSLVTNCVDNHLRRELKLLKPKVIVTVGSHPLKYIRKQTGITNYHGSWLFLNEFRAWSFAIFHPSFVLRCANDENKKHVVVQFESDIGKLAHDWRDIVESDDRMQMTEFEWQKHTELTWRLDAGMVSDKPIEEDIL